MATEPDSDTGLVRIKTGILDRLRDGSGPLELVWPCLKYADATELHVEQWHEVYRKTVASTYARKLLIHASASKKLRKLALYVDNVLYKVGAVISEHDVSWVIDLFDDKDEAIVRNTLRPIVEVGNHDNTDNKVIIFLF